MMTRFIRTATAIALTVAAIGCSVNPSHSNPDVLPMYGGLDRSANPELKRIDDKFIAGVTEEFGSRERASQISVEQGIRYYGVGDYNSAMRRFNQAWLLDPSNPDVYWGYSTVYHDAGENCKAKEMIDMALDRNLSKAIAIADAGRIYTLCGVDPSQTIMRRAMLKRSDELYRIAETKAPNNNYTFESWASAYYWREDYIEAWKMIAKARGAGGTPSAQFINTLREKMPEPNQGR